LQSKNEYEGDRIMGINIGLDIGIASVGLAVVDSDTGNVLETVADLFNCAEVSENVKRREFRQARRLKRRQHTRLEDFKKLWGAEGFIIPKNINLYSLELKVRALQEKITMDELYVVLYNSLKHRGISYLDDFEESTEGGSEYQKGIQINQQELETKYPCQIQLERFKKYGAYRGQIIVEENGDKTVLSNVYTFSAYKKEIDTILEAQSKYYPELTNDFIEKYQRIFSRKRKYYEGPGTEKSRTDYGIYTTRIDKSTGNYITEENIFEKLIGKCSVFPEEMRAAAASYSAQEFNLLNDLNNLTIGGRKLEEEEKRQIVETIKNSQRVNVEKIICTVSGENAETIEGARIKDDKHIYHSFEAYRKMKKALSEAGKNIEEYERAELDEIGRILTLNTEHESIEKELIDSGIGMSKEEIDSLINLRKEDGKPFSKWHSFSLKLLNILIPEMYEQPKEQMTLLSEMKLLKSADELYKGLKYIPQEAMTNEIYNPVVVRSARIAVKALNAVIKKYGNPELVVIEMPRDKNDEEQKQRIKQEQSRNEKELKEIIDKIKSEYGIQVTSAHFRNHKQLALKLKLWNEQEGICLYSGKQIDINQLLTASDMYEIDHIIPLSISFNDSRNNKVLVYATENQEKGQTTPYKYLTMLHRGWGWNEYVAKVNELHRKKNINYKKVENLLFMKDITKIDVLKGFINRNLNDTRYASRVVLNTLQSFFRANETGTKVSVICGAYTSQMRKNMRLDKNREESFAHHAVDALLIVYSQMGYNTFRKLQGEFIDFETGEILNPEMWKENMTDEVYEKCLYGQEGQKWLEIRNNIKETEKHVKYWHKVDKKCNRALCNQTIYGTRNLDGGVYKISKIKDIRSIDGYKKFAEMIKKGKQNSFLMARNDPKTFASLLEICERYKDAKNPFVQYEKETGDWVRRYAKKNNGPKIVSLKYVDGEVNSCIDVSHKYGYERNSRKVILASLNPYRMDVYYNKNDSKYYLIGIKQSDVKFEAGKSVIDEEAYTRILQQEKMLQEGQGRADLEKLGYEFRLSFYRNNIIQYEKGGEIFTERFQSRTMPAQRNYIETKPVDRAKFNRQNLVGLGKTTSIKKVHVDILGNQYITEKEIFSFEC
jgi:CRISPR-associated endonuclease Csn1